MLARNSTVIDPNKSKEFNDYLRKIAKDKTFWNSVKEKASVSFDRNEVDRLFAQDEADNK